MEPNKNQNLVHALAMQKNVCLAMILAVIIGASIIVFNRLKYEYGEESLQASDVKYTVSFWAISEDNRYHQYSMVTMGSGAGFYIDGSWVGVVEDIRGYSENLTKENIKNIFDGTKKDYLKFNKILDSKEYLMTMHIQSKVELRQDIQDQADELLAHEDPRVLQAVSESLSRLIAWVKNRDSRLEREHLPKVHPAEIGD